MKLQRPKSFDIGQIERLIKKHKVLQVVVEPENKNQAIRLKELGFKISSPFIPSKTVVLQLNKSDKMLYESFAKNTRYAIRKSENVAIDETSDFVNFRKCWRSSVNYSRQVLSAWKMGHLHKAFGKDCVFLLAGDGSAGAIFLVAGKVGYYWYGFANKDGRKSLALYKVVWEGMRWCKSRGATHFDMEGIYDERFPIDTWIGFTRFKKGFGGRVVRYPGAYHKLSFLEWLL